MKISNTAMSKFFMVILCACLFMGLTPVLGWPYINQTPAPTPTIEYSDEVVHIKTAEQLASIGESGNVYKTYVLDNDIDLVDEWVPIEGFRGTFDGQGHRINNLYVLKNSTRHNAGLFGYINGVTIKNVCVNINTNGISAYLSSRYVASAGGLAGSSGGYGATVENCYVKGDITATATDGYVFVGGLIGISYGSIIVKNCYTTGDITATSTAGSCVGGLIGWSSKATVENCYATADVTGTSSSYVYAGGLVGDANSVTVKNSYATGKVAATTVFRNNAYVGGLIGNGDVTVRSCYRLSSQKIMGNTINDAGKPLSSEAMKKQRSFVGWNFMTVWAIDPNINEGYPYLIMSNEKSFLESFWGITLLVVVVSVIVSVVYVLKKSRHKQHTSIR